MIEGCSVSTRLGVLNTDHVLFIAAGAFHQTAPADLLPELQGRLPVRVTLEPLEEDDFVRILGETEASLVKQTVAMLATEGVEVTITACAIRAVARHAVRMNREVENLGARRLRTIMAKVTEEMSFDAPRMGQGGGQGRGQGRGQEDGQEEGGGAVGVVIDEAFVEREMKGVAKEMDLSRYIL